MHVARSKVTGQGQISIPLQVRKDLNIRPGTEMVWEKRESGEYVIRPKRFALADVHRLLAGEAPVALTDEEIRQARRDFLTRRFSPPPGEGEK